MKMLAPYFPAMGKPWTATESLPGGNFSCSREQLAQTITEQYPWIDSKLAFRYVRQFGTHAFTLLSGINNVEEMGQEFAQGVYQAEIDYMIKHELAKTGEDLLWRRSKLGLYLSSEQQQAVTDYVASQQKVTTVEFAKVC
jgi:glycerol-3-phosphate dehydrogenase